MNFAKHQDKLDISTPDREAEDHQGTTDPRHRVVFHTLRHTFASWLDLQGETQLIIEELMGHKTLAMTMRNAHLIPDEKKKAVERLAGL